MLFSICQRLDTASLLVRFNSFVILQVIFDRR